ncbi:hypothetical protein PAHAL_7G285800 [Panicum hallii]|uniref:Uncharacterized protein n=1 Tax=Panicum hallii TaxID=206008 RepID=A0A2T8IDT9_9POAL|nr:hypothetical protein PAHAL_7G285800 [Panicum hallii]
MVGLRGAECLFGAARGSPPNPYRLRWWRRPSFAEGKPPRENEDPTSKLSSDIGACM